jgi:hypothetical protein
MHKHSTSDPNFQSASGLPSVDPVSAVARRPSTAAGKYIQHRYHVRPELADLIAELMTTPTDSSCVRGEVA